MRKEKKAIKEAKRFVKKCGGINKIFRGFQKKEGFDEDEGVFVVDVENGYYLRIACTKGIEAPIGMLLKENDYQNLNILSLDEYYTGKKGFDKHANELIKKGSMIMLFDGKKKCVVRKLKQEIK